MTPQLPATRCRDRKVINDNSLWAKLGLNLFFVTVVVVSEHCTVTVVSSQLGNFYVLILTFLSLGNYWLQKPDN